MERDFSSKIWRPYTSVTFADPEMVVKTFGNKYIIRKNSSSNSSSNNKRTYLNFAGQPDNQGEAIEEILDAISSWWVVTHGHNHPEIVNAIKLQLDELVQIIFTQFHHERADELIQELQKLLPSPNSICQGELLPNHSSEEEFIKFFFSDNGSTSVEVAIKMAVQYWQLLGESRTHFIALENSYHGDTFGAMAVSERSIFTDVFKDLLFKVHHIKLPDIINNGQRKLDVSTSDFPEQFISICQNYPVAGFIFEPKVQGAGGMIFNHPEDLQKLISYAKSEGILCIADEVMTGFGRTGKHFATGDFQILPDIICLSKGLTGGFLPMGLTILNQKIISVFEKKEGQLFYHGHSFTGNALSCAAAVAACKLQSQPLCTEQIRMISKLQAEFVNHLTYNISEESTNKFKNPRSCGTIFAIDLITGDQGYQSRIKSKIISYARSRGVLLRPLGNVVYTLPPYCTTDTEVLHIQNVITEGIISDWT